MLQYNKKTDDKVFFKKGLNNLLFKIKAFAYF